MKKWAEWLFSNQRRVSALIFPCTISLILSFFISWTVLDQQPAFGTRMMITALAVSGIWTALLALDIRRIARKDFRRTLQCSPAAALVLSVFLGLFFAYTVWGSGYLSLAPMERLDNGTSHLDTLYMSSVAESFKRGLAPSTLLNNEPYLPYHTFSNLLMGALSAVFGMPAYAAYNYLYPVLCIPVYMLAQIMAVSAAGAYFGKRESVTLPHLAVITLVNAGFLYKTLLDEHGVWKVNNVVSESHLIALTLMFLCYGMIFRVLADPGAGRRRRNLLVFLVIPLGIFLMTWCKVSVGLLFAFSVMYYVFRMHIREIRYWGINILYGCVLLAALWLFSLSGSMFLPSKNGSGFHLAAFRWYCPGPLGIWGHYAILLIMPALVVILEAVRLRKEKREGKRIFAGGGTVWIEDLVLFAGIAFLPGFLIDIDGGSGYYFSSVLEIPALLLLCGHRYFSGEGRKLPGWARAAVCTLCVVWCACMCWVNKSPDPMRFVTGTHESNLSGTLLETRQTYGKHPADYTGRRVEMKTAYIWPAMTGIGVINATYAANGAVYTYEGNDTTNYGSEYTDNDRAMTLEEAEEKARSMGKKGVLHVTADGVELVEIYREE